jgi:tetratricopeptide (TPR) repeat protein
MGRPPANIRPDGREASAPQKTAIPGESRRRPPWPLIAGSLCVCLLVAGWGFWRLRHPTPNPDAIWQRAQDHFRAGRYEQAAVDLDQLGQLRAPTPLDWFLRAKVAAIRDHLDEALADLAHVPDSHPDAAEGWLITGQIERRRDRVRFAEQAFLHAIKLDPSLALAHRELIRIYGIQLRRLEFNREFQALQRLTALSFDDVYHWTSVRNNLWEPSAVALDLLRFVAADPLDRPSRLAVTDIFRRMGRETDSLLAPLSPDDPEALAIRVQIALGSEDGKEVDRLLALGPPDNPSLARLRGSKAIARRDAEEAIRQFRIAYAADPDDHETVSGLRVAYGLSGNEKDTTFFREAAANLGRLNTLLQRGSAEGARKDLELFREFGVACAALHRDSEARAWFGLAIAGNPLDAESQKALFRLDEASRARPDDGHGKVLPPR